jgi:cobalt-zinc-cadmium efflux system protein
MEQHGPRGHSSDHDHGDHGPLGHGHAHVMPTQQINTRMAVAVGLNLIFVVIEGGFGLVSNSVALIADAGHNLSDVLGLICAWTAIYLGRRPPGARFTYGLGRSSVLAALANAVLLLVACGAIAWEALGRLA